jgi:cell division protein FtsB
VAAICVPFEVFGPQGLARVEQLRRELIVLKETNKRIKRENEAIIKEIKAFHSDPRYIEKTARGELGMVGPGEIIYQFPNE